MFFSCISHLSKYHLTGSTYLYKNGILICHQWVCQQRVKSALLFLYLSVVSGLWVKIIFFLLFLIFSNIFILSSPAQLFHNQIKLNFSNSTTLLSI